MLELPQLFGGTEVLEKAKSLTDEEECIQAVSRLEELYELLKNNNYDKYISFDLGGYLNMHTIQVLFSMHIHLELVSPL